MNKPHKWAKEIKAWADGAEIQCRYVGGVNWGSAPNPSWHDDLEYRVKPREPREWWLVYDARCDRYVAWMKGSPCPIYGADAIKVREVLE